MYLPKAFDDPDLEAMVDTVRSIGFGHLVVAGPSLASTPLPFLIDVADNGVRVRGHLARGNDVHGVAPCEALLIVAGADAYVSPSWYPSKHVDGKVVPTWNYEVVHLHGQLVAHDDAEWLLGFVNELTAHHEAEMAQPWSTADAPTNYIDTMVRGIVGIELSVTSWTCKRKLSQNQPEPNRLGALAGLSASKERRAQDMAAAMNR
jgi:transcriptional regulator